MNPYIYPVSTQANQNIKRHYLGKKTERKCIYCGKSNRETTFKKDAHIIPASLGNRILYNYNECDKCNEDYFSVQENELANFLMLDRIFIGSSKRNGLPKYKPLSKGNSSIEHSPDSRTVNLNLDNIEGKFEINVDEQNKKLTYIVNDPLPYRPVDICKSLVHMIWPFLSADYREKLSYIPNWLEGKVSIFPLFLDVLFVPGNGFSQGILEGWESHDPESKYPIIVRFTFGLKILSFYIPSSLEVHENPPAFQNYLQLPDTMEGLIVERYPINNNNRRTPSNLTYNFSFQSMSSKEL